MADTNDVVVDGVGATADASSDAARKVTTKAGGYTYVIAACSLVVLIQGWLDCAAIASCLDCYMGRMSRCSDECSIELTSVAWIAEFFDQLSPGYTINSVPPLMVYVTCVGGISLFLCLCHMIAEPKGVVTDAMNLFFALFMLLWWLVGASIVTFKVYPIASNAYLASWIAAAAAVKLAETKLQSVQSVTAFVSALGPGKSILLIASIVELCAASFVMMMYADLFQEQQCNDACKSIKNYNAWALSAGIVSTIMALCMIFVTEVKEHEKMMSIFLVVWWMAGAGLNTFKGPFNVTGNGYFASWICLFAAGRILQFAE